MSLFSIILLVLLGGCKSLPHVNLGEERKEEVDEESAEAASNKEEAGYEEEYMITKSEYFEMPDEIILYNKSEQITIKKNTEIYNNIIYITNERFKEDCGMAEEIISNEFVKDIKNKFAIEFIYNKKMQTIYKCYEYRFVKNYTKILFPLPDFRAIFGPYQYESQDGHKQEYQNGPLYVSTQPESDYLIEIIEEEFNK